MNLKTKIRISIFLFLIFCGFSIFLLKNLFSEIKNISNEITLKRGEILLLEEKEKNARFFSDFFQRERENFEKVDLLFIDPKFPVKFIEFLERESENLNLSLEISPLPPLIKAEKDPWPSIGFRLSLSGSFSNFLKFLEKLESAFYLIETQNLRISRVEKAEKELKVGQIKAEISIKVFTK